MKARHIGYALLVLLVVLGIAAGILLRPNPPAEACTPVLDLNKVRQLANSMPGDKPRAVHIEQVVEFAMPGTLTHAGTPPVSQHMMASAFQLVFPDHTLVIDSAMPKILADNPALVRFNDAAFERVVRGLEAASAIYVTHEHADHMGGIFADGHTAFARAKFTAEQLAHTDLAAPMVIPEVARAQLQTLAYDHAIAVAPGVVLIKAPGHTPGSQWVFVSRQDGTELLLVGDSAWFMGNIDDEQGPPLLMSLMLKNDRPATACQLSELHALQKAEPTVVIVPGHDIKRFEQLVLQGVLLPNFSLPPQ